MDYYWLRVAKNQDAWYYGNGRPARTASQVMATNSYVLGTEWDAFTVYDVCKALQFQFGYCHFLPGAVIAKSSFHEKSSYMIFQTFYKF